LRRAERQEEGKRKRERRSSRADRENLGTTIARWGRSNGMEYAEEDDEPGSPSARVAMGPPAAPAQALYHGDDFLLVLPYRGSGRVDAGRDGPGHPPRLLRPQWKYPLPSLSCGNNFHAKEFLSYPFFLSFLCQIDLAISLFQISTWEIHYQIRHMWVLFGSILMFSNIYRS
jgi:hypothetical protein